MNAIFDFSNLCQSFPKMDLANKKVFVKQVNNDIQNRLCHFK
jgi:hypothetical protein